MFDRKSLGLDISTTHIGYVLFDREGEFELDGHIDISKIKNFNEKIRKVELVLEDIILTEGTLNIFIEEYMKGFKKGKSSVQTMMKLAAMNVAVTYLCYSLNGMSDKYIHKLDVNSARTELGIDYGKNVDTKAEVLYYVSNNEPKFSYENTIHGNPKVGTYDRADSWVIGKVGMIYEGKGYPE